MTSPGRPVTRLLSWLVLLPVALICVGCATTGTVRATDYELQIELDPQSNRIDGYAEIICVRPDVQGVEASPLVVNLRLHPDVTIREVQADMASILTWRHTSNAPEGADDDEAPARWARIWMRRAPQAFRLRVNWDGRLEDDIEAGQAPDAIHNFGVRAHVSPQGIYLGSGNGWYPKVFTSPDGEPSNHLAHYHIQVAPVEGYTFVAGADTVTSTTSEAAGLVAESKYPLDGLALVGGRYRTYRRQDGGVQYAVMLRESSGDESVLAQRAEVFLDAAIDYVHRYEPLIGLYPFEEFAIVENFFSSGFAFPTFTLLGPKVMAMGPRALRHGYLDHEILHSWWGNGAYVDPRGGNWCEALASYGANYYGLVLDGDASAARDQRRDACKLISRIPQSKIKPLAAFGTEDGASRGVGYQVGAMVLHMLAQRIGESTLWEALAAMTAERMGAYASWATIREHCERVSGQPLDDFFDQWVNGAGAASIQIERAWVNGDGSNAGRVAYVKIRQSAPMRDVKLPLRIHNGDGSTIDVLADVSDEVQHAAVSDVILPAEIELDPDYHVLRRLPPESMLPTLASVTTAKRAYVITGNVEPWEGYETFCNLIARRRGERTIERLKVRDLRLEMIADDALAIIGDAVHHPKLADLLMRSTCPVQFTQSGFTIEGVDYNEPGHSVLCTVHHPDAPARTITVYYGNSPEALSNAAILGFYGNSMLVFEAPTGAAAGHGGPPPPVVLRRDFEPDVRIPVESPDTQP